MPNWCMTRAVIYGPSKEVHSFKEFIEKALKDQPNKDASNPEQWLGQIVIAASGDSNNVYCRGWIQYIEEIENGEDGEAHFFIDSDDAWSPLLPNVLQHAIDKKFPNSSLQMEYTAEEPGCGIYVNTDTSGKFFAERFMLCYNDEYVYFSNEKELYEFLGKFYDVHFTSIQEVQEWADESENDVECFEEYATA